MESKETQPEAPDMDTRLVSVSDLEANDYNPNEIDSEKFESLVSTIRHEGYVKQSILVAEKPGEPGKYLIVDGEHRWKAAQIAGVRQVLVFVVPYDEVKAKVDTLAMNAIRGQNIPIKLAKIIVSLQKDYSDAEIAAMTGIGRDEQQSVLKLLEVPDHKPDDGVHLTAEKIDRPISVNLMLMPDEHGCYTAAIKKAIKLAGEDVTVLIGNEVQDYNKVMGTAMGIAGVKLRNVALAAICDAFLHLTKPEQEALVKGYMAKTMVDKRASDSEAKEQKAQASDKTVRTRTRA